MSKNSINVDLDDPRAGKIAEVISSKSAKKILSEIADSGKEGLSESDLVEKLKMKANTVNYNIKKLQESGLIEKVSGFLWSVKGKRIFKYRVSNRKIVISPRSIMKGVLPAVLISGFLALVIRFFGFESFSLSSNHASKDLLVESVQTAGNEMALRAGDSVTEVTQIGMSDPNLALWFFLGALVSLLIFLLWSWYSNK